MLIRPKVDLPDDLLTSQPNFVHRASSAVINGTWCMFSSVCIWLGPSVMVCWLCFLPPPLALSFSGPAQIPDSPAAPKLLSLLSLTLSSLARLFSHLLRRPPSEVLRWRPDFSLLLPSLPAAGLAPGREERPCRLSLLLRAALTLPGPPSGGRSPQEEDASAGQRWSMPVSTVYSTVPNPGLTQTPASPAPS